MTKREWVREPDDEAVRNLQRTLQGAVKRLSEDLYSGEVPGQFLGRFAVSSTQPRIFLEMGNPKV